MPSQLRIPRPACAVCDRPVEELRWRKDPHLGVLRFTAVCHGRLEVTSLPLSMLQDPDVTILPGRAFTSPKEIEP